MSKNQHTTFKVATAKKSNRSRVIFSFILTFFLGFGFFSYVNAADSSSNNDSMGTACCNAIVNAINSLKSVVVADSVATLSLLNELVNSSYNFSSEITTASGSGYIQDQGLVALKTAGLTTGLTQNTLVRNSSQSKQLSSSLANLVPKQSSNNSSQSAANFSISSLLGTSSLTTQQDAAAKNLILFLSNQGNPVPLLDSKYDNSDNSSFQTYRNSLGAYTAIQSTAINSLYHLLETRTPQDGLGAFIGLAPNTQASPLQLQAYMANRALSAEWMSSIVQASPSDVQREILFSLSNLQHMMFMNYQQMEQLNASLAVQILQQQSGITRANLLQLRDTAMKSTSS